MSPASKCQQSVAYIPLLQGSEALSYAMDLFLKCFLCETSLRITVKMFPAWSSLTATDRVKLEFVG
jgi:hypothetical protein